MTKKKETLAKNKDIPTNKMRLMSEPMIRNQMKNEKYKNKLKMKVENLEREREKRTGILWRGT